MLQRNIWVCLCGAFTCFWILLFHCSFILFISLFHGKGGRGEKFESQNTFYVAVCKSWVCMIFLILQPIIMKHIILIFYLVDNMLCYEFWKVLKVYSSIRLVPASFHLSFSIISFIFPCLWACTYVLVHIVSWWKLLLFHIVNVLMALSKLFIAYIKI